MITDRKILTAAQAIVACIQREEIKKVFCVPGESYLPVLDAIYDEQSIQLISARHEGGAAFMAEGYAKATLKPGVVFATRAVGGSNLAIGIHTAYQDSTPMVVFLGQVSSKFLRREGFQEVDVESYFRPIAKWVIEITEPARIPELVGRAFRVSQTGRPGPVVVSLPEDILPIKTETEFGPVLTIPSPAPAEFEIEQVAKILNQAKKPLIIAGGGIKQAKAEDLLIDFAEKYSFPVLASFRRHDCFPNDNGHYVGHLGLGTADGILQTVKEADIILALGTRLSEVTTQDYSIISSDKKLVHIDIDYDTIGKVYAPELGIVADMREALKQLIGMKLNVIWKDWTLERRQVYENSSNLVIAEHDGINKKVMAILKDTLPADTIITNDAGNFAGWLHTYYPFKEKHTYIGPTSGAMGYGMPAALGAKLAFPEKLVVSLSGDGGFLMTVQEIESAVRYQIPVICLVFNNNMYGTIRMHQEIHYPKKVIGTSLGHISFKDLAISMGADGYQVKTAEEFSIALNQAMVKQMITVIEIITEKEQISVTATIEELRRK